MMKNFFFTERTILLNEQFYWTTFSEIMNKIDGKWTTILKPNGINFLTIKTQNESFSKNERPSLATALF